MNRDKLLITFFFLAAIADIVTTLFGLNLAGFREVGVNGSAQIAAGAGMNAMVFRMAITGFMIGAYALFKHREHAFLWNSFEKALVIANPITWAVVFFNTFQIALYFAAANGRV